MAQGYPQNIQGTIAAETQTGFGRRGREAGQTACKPGSVPSRRKRRSFLWTAPRGTVLATYPDGSSGEPCRSEPRRVVPIRSCSRRGLPCRPGHPVRGGLLPHPFTLTAKSRRSQRRFAFCGAIPGVTPGGRYPPPCHRGARTFLPRTEMRERPPGRLVRAEGGRGGASGQAGRDLPPPCAPSVSPCFARRSTSPVLRVRSEVARSCSSPAQRGRWRGAQRRDGGGANAASAFVRGLA